MLASTPASILNHKPNRQGIPYDSHFRKNALATAQITGKVAQMLGRGVVGERPKMAQSCVFHHHNRLAWPLLIRGLSQANQVFK
jgi:hypothetical protein